MTLRSARRPRPLSGDAHTLIPCPALLPARSRRAAQEGRGIVDLHRNYKHAMATGDYNYAQELEEEMKMMRFNWGKEKQHMEVG